MVLTQEQANIQAVLFLYLPSFLRSLPPSQPHQKKIAGLYTFLHNMAVQWQVNTFILNLSNSLSLPSSGVKYRLLMKAFPLPKLFTGFGVNVLTVELYIFYLQVPSGTAASSLTITCTCTHRHIDTCANTKYNPYIYTSILNAYVRFLLCIFCAHRSCVRSSEG